MRTNNTANAHLDAGLLASYEAGSAFAIDDATYRADKLAHVAVASSPFGVKITALSLPASSRVPQSFLVEGRQVSLTKKGAAPPCGTLLYFRREGGGSWKIALEPTVDSDNVVSPSLDRGYAVPVSASEVSRADAVPVEFVAALRNEETSGLLGPFKAAMFTGKCWQLPDPRSDVKYAEAHGFIQRDLYSMPSPPDTAAVALRGGSTLVLFTVRFDNQLLAPSASESISWTHPSRAAGPSLEWTYFLKAGNYSVVSERGDLEVAAVLEAGSNTWRVIGSYVGVTSVVGTKSRSKTTPTGTLAAFVTRRAA